VRCQLRGLFDIVPRAEKSVKYDKVTINDERVVVVQENVDLAFKPWRQVIDCPDELR
jgi:hypothetical protein